MTNATPSISALAVNHAAMIRESAISDAQASATLPDGTPRYQSVQNSSLLKQSGFSLVQHQLPGLLISSRDATGATYCQYRPDRPVKGRGKYETPAEKGKYGLDIPELVRAEVLEGTGELWLTEGGKKSDGAVSAGLVCVSLPGVWMFNRFKKPLPDWDIIPLRGRIVVICYDSDAMTKESVYAALRQLSALLKKHSAVVRYCYLPDDGENKVGIDDYLAVGHSVEDLRGLVSDKLKPIATAPVQALINTLNRKCEGVATFNENRVNFSGEASEKNTLFALSEIFRQKQAVDKAFKFWAGDAYAALRLPHGSKEATVTDAIGKGNFLQVREWARVARAFSGERDYFRCAAPWWFLELAAARNEEEQDELLREFLERKTESEGRMTRDELRERLHDTPEKKSSGGPQHGHSGGMQGQALFALIMRASAEDRQRLLEMNRTYGSTCVSVAIAKLLPEGIHWLLEQAENLLQENAAPFPGKEEGIQYEGSTYSAPAPNTNTGVTSQPDEDLPLSALEMREDSPKNESSAGDSKITAAVTSESCDEIEKSELSYAVVFAKSVRAASDAELFAPEVDLTRAVVCAAPLLPSVPDAEPDAKPAAPPQVSLTLSTEAAALLLRYKEVITANLSETIFPAIIVPGKPHLTVSMPAHAVRVAAQKIQYATSSANVWQGIVILDAVQSWLEQQRKLAEV